LLIADLLYRGIWNIADDIQFRLVGYYFVSMRNGEYYSKMLQLYPDDDKSKLLMEALRCTYAPWNPKFIGDTLAERIVSDEKIVGKSLRFLLERNNDDKIVLKDNHQDV
jgi:hypothetical protein